MTLNKISTIVGLIALLLGGMSTMVVYIYDYHQTLSSNKDNQSLYLDVRLIDTQNWITYYSDIPNLNANQQRNLDKLIRTQERLELQRSKVLGFTDD